MKAYEDLLARSQSVSQTPFQAYSGPEVAPINAQQTAGFGNINAGASGFFPYAGQAGADIAGGTSAVTNADINQYMDPYTQQVINATQADFDTQNKRANSIVTGNAAAQGALGGNRVGVAQALTQEGQERTQAPVIAGLRSQGFQSAEQMANAQKARQITGGQTLAQTGMQEAGAQVSAGTLEQQTEQAKNTQAMTDYYTAQGYPFATAQWLASISLPTGALMGSTSTGTSQTEGPQPNQWMQGAGLGLSALSLFSDKRLKENIEEIGRLHDGQKVYRYNFKGDPTTQVGLISQEVEKTHPEAVRKVSGFGTVDYDAATEDAIKRWSGGAIKGFAAGGGPYGETGTPWGGGRGWVPTVGAPKVTPLQSSPFPQHAKMDAQKQPDISKMGTQLGTIGKSLFDKFSIPNLSNSQGETNAGSMDDWSAGFNDVSFDRGGGVPISSGFGGSSFAPGGGVDDTADTPLLSYSPESQNLDAGTSAVSPSIVEKGVDAFKNIEPGRGFGSSGENVRPPRGIRNNNPGNIEDSPFAKSQPGYAGTDGRFAKYESPDQGIAAIDKLLQTYGSKGINTIGGVIARWAPPSDNNPTSTYAATVAKEIGVDPNTPIDLNDPSVRQKIALGITKFENGSGASGYAPQTNSVRASVPGVAATDSAGVAAPSSSGMGGFNPLNLSDEARQGLISMGLGMMANRRGGKGSFLAGVGEAGEQGMATYASAKAQTAQRLLEQQKLEQARLMHNTMTPYQKAQLEIHKEQLNRESFTPIPGVTTDDGHPIGYDKRNPKQAIDMITMQPLTEDQKKSTSSGGWKPFGDKTTTDGDPVLINSHGETKNAVTGQKLDSSTKLISSKELQLSGQSADIRAHQLAAGDIKGAYAGLPFGSGGNRAKQQVGELARQKLIDSGMSPKEAGEYLSAQAQSYAATGVGLSSEARTAGVREANLKIILKAADAAIPAAIEASEKVARTGWVPINTIIQKGQVIASSPELKEFGMANLQLAEHWARAMNPTGVMRESDRDMALHFLSTADSKETYARAVAQLKKQIDRELVAVQGVKAHGGFGAKLPEGSATYDSAKKELAELSTTAPTAKTPTDKAALDWAKANPTDPRAAAIKKKLGVP